MSENTNDRQQPVTKNRHTPGPWADHQECHGLFVIAAIAKARGE